MNPIDLTGSRFGRLIAVALNGHAGRDRTWLCKCDCGKTTIVRIHSLKTGNTTSCGCLRLERVTRHGQIDLPEYAIWKAAKQRCTNPKSKRWYTHGGRGIRMCERWLHDFGAFLSNMGKRPDGLTLDRINNDGDYSPENCRWATTFQQATNRRSNRLVTWNAETLTLMEWSKRTGLRFSTLKGRLDSGWPIDQVFSLPPDRNRRRLKRAAPTHGSSPSTTQGRRPAQRLGVR